MIQNRARLLQNGRDIKGPVIYWMSRDQRAYDNWALIYASETARERKVPLVVVFTLTHEYPGAREAHYSFMLTGLEELKNSLNNLNIPFILLEGDPVVSVPAFAKEISACVIICDFDPLKIKRVWKRDLAKNIDIPFFEVDAHNIVPCLYASQKEEWGAYTLRPKIHRHLPEYLDEYPDLQKQEAAELMNYPCADIQQINLSLKTRQLITPGEAAAFRQLDDFILRLNGYDSGRNDPNQNAQSGLSPYLHFGQISAQRIALEIRKRATASEDTEAFLEELIIRRELADNFCYYNRNYDNFDGLQNWAKETLTKHIDDDREYVYNFNEFESARTHDPLWNAAQIEMLSTGKMHGYMRMYWAKKILEWSKTPDEALRTAITLNDKYQMDGRDPNGYTGCAWAIGGIHDRAWNERPVFGKIRFMNYNGCKRKFKIEAYINKHSF